MTTNQNQPPTTTDLALTPRQERQLAVRDDLAPGARPAAIIPRNFIEAQQLCQALASSSLVPKAYRTATGAVDMLLVVMTGSELGIPPMAALRLFTTWDGVPRLMAEGIRAVMMMASDIEYFEMATGDDTHATWIGKRRGRPEKAVTWTMERAKRAGLTGKENWSKYQEAMLNARASMDLGRILAPDVISGMRSLEEAQDGDFIASQSTERKTEFSAPPVLVAPQGPPPGVPMPEPIKPRAGRLPRDKSAETKVIDASSAEAFNASIPGANAPRTVRDPEEDHVPGFPSAVECKSPSSSASTASSASTSNAGGGSSSAAGARLDEAVEKARSADATRAAVPTTPPANSSVMPASPSPAPSGPAVATETSSSASGDPEPGADDSFGEDPIDAPPAPSGNRLADFFAELARCANQREVAEVGNKWRAWSKAQAEGGDASYGKNGENAAKMGKMYATRKAEVPS